METIIKKRMKTVYNFSITVILLHFISVFGLNGQPVPVIFDTDMGSDCDDVGALALLNAYTDKGKAAIVGCIYSSGNVPYGAGIIDAINTLYGRPNIPIGADHEMNFGDPKDKMTAEKLSKDTAAFKNNIIHNKDADEQTKLNRKLLVNSPDQSITYITVGHTKGLYQLMQSEPDEISELCGYELVKKKVKRWIGLGAVNADNDEGNYVKDWNFFFNETAIYTRYLVDSFPNQTVFIGCGTNVLSGKSLKYTPSGNIVRTAYRDWLWNVFEHTLDDQRPSWDLIAVYYAVEGLGNFLEDIGSGRLKFELDKGSKWINGINNRNHTYIRLKPGVEDDFGTYLNNWLAASLK